MGVILIPMFTSSSFNSNEHIVKKQNLEVLKKVVQDTTTRERIFNETGLKIPKHVPKDHVRLIYSEAKKQQIPLKILVKVIRVESNFKADALNRNTGAKGYMQLMPSTYKLYRKKLKLDISPISNIKIGAFYLKEMYNIWDRVNYTEDKKWRLALASYNAGINNVIKIKKVPNIKETIDFVNFIIE